MVKTLMLTAALVLGACAASSAHIADGPEPDAGAGGADAGPVDRADAWGESDGLPPGHLPSTSLPSLAWPPVVPCVEDVECGPGAVACVDGACAVVP